MVEPARGLPAAKASHPHPPQAPLARDTWEDPQVCLLINAQERHQGRDTEALVTAVLTPRQGDAALPPAALTPPPDAGGSQGVRHRQAGRERAEQVQKLHRHATRGPIRRGAATAARAPRPQCTAHERGAEQPFQRKMGPIVTEETWQDFYINVTWGNTTLRSLSQNQRQTEGMFATYNAELVSLMNKAPTI